jgi:hypothetical protein
MSEYVEHRYLTDDRGDRARNELVIYWAPNGDFYLATAPEGEGTIGREVRISTSGGASFANPKLLEAVRLLFEALGGWGEASEVKGGDPTVP